MIFATIADELLLYVMFLLKHSSLNLGKRDPHHIVVTSSYLPEDGNEAQYGSLFFTFVLKDHKELAAELKNIIIESFKQHFYQDLERSPEQSFEETLQAINDGANRLAQAENIVWEESLSISLGLFSGNDLHLSVGGAGGVYLLRGQHLTLISEGLVPEKGGSENKVFFSLASGNLLASDRVLLSTDQLEEIVDMHALKARIQKTHPLENEEDIPSLGHAHIQTITCEDIVDADIPEEAPHLTTTVHRPEAMSKPNLPTSSGSKLGNTFEILKNNLKKSLQRIFNRNQPLVRKSLPMNKIIAGGVVAVMALGGLYWFASAQQSASAKKDLQVLLTQVSKDREDAKARINIDRDSAKNLLIADQKKLVDAITATNDAMMKVQIQGQLDDIKALLADADHVYKVDSPKIAYDLSQERSNFAGKGLVRLGNDLYAFDSDALYRLALDKPTRRTVIVDGNTVNAISMATTVTKDGTIELYTEDHKLIEFKNDTFTSIKAPGGDTATWKPAVDLTEYADRKFVYFLDPAGNTVWRYGKDNTTNEFQAPVSKNVAQLNMGKAVSITVDGAVYILSADGQISKTYADEKQDFVIDGLTDPFNSPTKIIADKNADTGSLYVLDAKNNRVVVLSKSGKYQSQYVFPQYNDILDIELVPGLTKDQLMLMTATGKVLQVELKPAS